MELNEILEDNANLASWYANVEAACSTYAVRGFPNIVPGSMDEEEGITHDAYLDYCRDLYDELLNGIDPGEDAPEFAALSFVEWRDMKREEVVETDDFNIYPCDCCGTGLAGARHKMTALPDDPSTDSRYVPLEVCSDCYLYLVNGDLPEDM